MDLSNQKTYWQKAAEHHIDVQHTADNKHFCVFTVEDALSSIKDLEYPAICLEIPEENLADLNSDNIRANSSGAILVVTKATQGNHAEITQAFLDMYVIASDMQSKMLNDRKKANQQGRVAPESLLKHLDLNTVRMVEVGPVFDSCYGWRVEFAFNGPKNLTLDEAKWLTGTETKFNHLNP